MSLRLTPELLFYMAGNMLRRASNSLAQVTALCTIITFSGCDGCLGKSVPEGQLPDQSSLRPTIAANASDNPAVAASGPIASSGQLESSDLKVGTGPAALKGKSIKVHYTGTFQDGKVFDSSRGREALSFTLGAGDVIQGWDKGVEGMKVGGKRRLVIPPALAYGDQGHPGIIPPKSTLIFEIELLGVE